MYGWLFINFRILQADEPKSENVVKNATPIKSPDEPSGENKSNKKRRKRVRRKNAPKKSTSINQLTASQISENIETNDTITDRSSLDSNASDPDIKDMQRWVYQIILHAMFCLIDMCVCVCYEI